MTIQEIEKKISDLVDHRNSMAQEKLQISTRMSEIRHKCQVRLPDQQFKKLNQERIALGTKLSDIESRIIGTNALISRLSQEKQVLYTEAKTTNATKDAPTEDKVVHMVRELSKLRDEYHQFSADKTRVASLRSQAAEFGNALTSIIRGYMA